MAYLKNIRALAERIENGDAAMHRNFVAIHRAKIADSQATFESIGSGTATYVTASSPLTQTFGLGFEKTAQDPNELVRQISDFYTAHHAPAAVELCQVTPVPYAAALIAHGYTIIEYSSVLVKKLTEQDVFLNLPKDFSIETVTDETRTKVAETIAAGFGTDPVLLAEIIIYFQLATDLSGARATFARYDNQIVGGSNLFIFEETAYLAGASVLQAFRGRGIQTAFIQERLSYAYNKGAQWAVVATEPGGVSEQNYLKLGFQIAYVRNKFMLPFKKD